MTFSKVYHGVPDDPKFATVWDDDHALALWLRLLLAADVAYPHPAYPPPDRDQGAWDTLVGADLIEERTGGRFVLVGMEAERAKRSEAGKAGGLASAAARAAKPTPPKPPVNTPSTAPPRLVNGGATTRQRPLNQVEVEVEVDEEVEVASPTPPNDDDDYLAAWYALTVRAPTPRVTAWLDRIAGDYGGGLLSRALAAEALVDSDPKDLITRTENRLWEEAHHQKRTALKRRRDKAAAERVALEDMPPEQRAANLARLRSGLQERGLLGPDRTKGTTT